MLQESADRFAVGIRTEAVVMCRGQRQRRSLGGGFAGFGVVREQRVVERAAPEGAAFGDECGAGAGRQRGLLTQVDDATERVGAIERRGRPTEDFH